MEDTRITELFWQRDERAIAEARSKYGAYCRTIAGNILQNQEDAEECVDDTLLRAWDSIPPDRPSRLSAYLGKIARNLAIDKYRRGTSQKRGGGQVALCLEELSECIGENKPVEDSVVLKDLINGFLRTLPEKSRRIFLFRYWYCMPIREVAAQCGASEGAVKMSLRRTRAALKEYLEKEGVGI